MKNIFKEQQTKFFYEKEGFLSKFVKSKVEK
jgi:hypothetical protein